MHILLIHQYYMEEDSGGGSRWNEMTKMWVKEGHQVTVLAGMMDATGTKKPIQYKGKLFAKVEAHGVTIIRCHVSESYNVNFIGRLWGYFSFVFSSTWAGLTKARDSYDLIVVTSPPLFVGITAYLLSVLKRVPFLFEIRDLWPESAIDTGVVTNPLIIKFAYWFEAFIYRKATKINVLTPAFELALRTKKQVSPEKIIYIPNAADFTLSDGLLNSFDAKEFRKKLNIDNHFVVTYVGAHGVANHLIQLLDAAELLKDTPALLVLIGEGMQKKMLKDETLKRGLTNIMFIDSVPKKEVFKYILASDMGMSVLKKNDTFKTVYSNKTFDYMSCKKPILMVIDGVSRALVEKANAGAFVEPENPEAFAEAVKLYMENEQLCKEQGLNGYNYAKANFDRSVLAKRYLDELTKL